MASNTIAQALEPKDLQPSRTMDDGDRDAVVIVLKTYWHAHEGLVGLVDITLPRRHCDWSLRGYTEEEEMKERVEMDLEWEVSMMEL